MKGDKDEKENIYRRYREVLGMPELSEEELFKIHCFFMEVGRILYEQQIDRIKRNKERRKPDKKRILNC